MANALLADCSAVSFSDPGLGLKLCGAAFFSKHRSPLRGLNLAWCLNSAPIGPRAGRSAFMLSYLRPWRVSQHWWAEAPHCSALGQIVGRCLMLRCLRLNSEKCVEQLQVDVTIDVSETDSWLALLGMLSLQVCVWWGWRGMKRVM